MWSNVFFDYSLHKNFNVGFASHKNDIHIHLSQWQYWWWFWFALVWSLYFLIILRLYNSKTENFNINLNTSLRSHGKWGDFLVAIIPLSWCGNILINSNFILRMIEWQNESSLFTVRIQGKQWYWVYKYSSDTNYRLNNVYINVGHNNWLKCTNQSNLNFNYNESTLSLIFDYEFKQNHKFALNKYQKIKNNLKNINLQSHSTNYSLLQNKIVDKTIPFLFKKNKTTTFDLINKSYNFNKELSKTVGNAIKKIRADKIALKPKFFEYYEYNDGINYNYSWNKMNPINLKKNINLINNKFIGINKKKKLENNINYFSLNSNYSKYYENDRLEDVYETAENLRKKNFKFPVKLLKGTLNKNNVNILKNSTSLNKNIFLNYKVNNDNITQKIPQIEQFWGFRQKRYKKLKSFSFVQSYKYSNTNYNYISNFVNNDNFSKYDLYTGVRNNKHKNELIPVTLARRLLRTKRTLILPAHINITLIAGSYDVVHSWFVPGLGLKIDCVPGRSTHHSLYIDNIGFYYGQCAEICGRYHHHMPIRVCALAFEHFMLWWQTKGLPRMYRSETFSNNKSILLNKFKYKTIVVI